MLIEKKAYPKTRIRKPRLPQGQWTMHKVRAGGGGCVLSLPAHVRAYLGIKSGDYVAVRVDDGAMLLRKLNLDSAIAESLRMPTTEGE